MASSFGTDIKCLSDIDPHFRLVSGASNVAYAIARRLQTTRGQLHYATNYGEDLSAYCNGDVTRSEMFACKRAVEAEAMKDERVKSARATVTWVPAEEKLRVQVEGKSKAGPFKLIQDVGDISVTVLAQGT